MPETNLEVLSTRPVNANLVLMAEAAGIHLSALSFIETEPIQSIEVQQEIEYALTQQVPVVFTSMNAVEAVAYYLEGVAPAWEVYCMGNTTKRLVTDYFGEEAIAGTGSDATELAETILGQGVEGDVIFFCGDQRRAELPDILRQNDIEVQEIEVYRTRKVPHTISVPLNGVLFFSPSAVDSFFSANKLAEQAIVFAIGDTTAAQVRRHTRNKIVISQEPGKDALVEQMIAFFSGR